MESCLEKDARYRLRDMGEAWAALRRLITESGRLSMIVSSRDGSLLAYVAATGSTTPLVLRRMDRLEAQPIAGTEGADYPFFSPDGEWIGFFATHEGKLKKVSVRGGAPIVLCDAAQSLGASWGDDGCSIVFSS